VSTLAAVGSDFYCSLSDRRWRWRGCTWFCVDYSVSNFVVVCLRCKIAKGAPKHNNRWRIFHHTQPLHTFSQSGAIEIGPRVSAHILSVARLYLPESYRRCRISDHHFFLGRGRPACLVLKHIGRHSLTGTRKVEVSQAGSRQA